MNKIPATLLAYRNKVSNKLQGVVRVPAQEKRKGYVLLSYITAPFTLAPWEIKTDPHSNYWESREIARQFSIRGYAVDCINAAEHRFTPKKPYVACIDVQQDLERLSKYLPVDCKKVIHIDNPNYKIYNEREKRRLSDLKKRRGADIKPQRQVASSESLSKADFLEGFGNESVFATYADLKKPIFPIPISVSKMFPFPKNKDFAQARKNFLYFGGGGAVLKGLDIAIEAFAKTPELTLHIVGPAAHEKDFAAEYAKELALPNVIRHGRPKIDKQGEMTVDGEPFANLTNQCVAIIYPSAAEGTSGAVIQAIHMGLIPIVTPETGLDEKLTEIGGALLNNPTVESVRKAAQEFAETDPVKLRETASKAWSYVRAHHTKETFSAAYGRFIDTILHL